MEPELFNKYVDILKKDVPDLKIKYKNESNFMKLLEKVLFFVPNFMDNYVTTMGSTVYYPSRDMILSDQRGAVEVLSHEVMHIVDSQTSMFYKTRYLFPQVIFLLIIPLMFLIGWWSLFCFVFLAPIPSFTRTSIELRGYCTSLFAYYKIKKINNVDADYTFSILRKRVDSMNKQFTGPSYYYMWPNGVEEYLLDFIEDIRNNNVLEQHNGYIIIDRAMDELFRDN